jgi:hypothetical protein
MSVPATQTRIVITTMAVGLIVLTCSTIVLLYAKSHLETELRQLKDASGELREKLQAKERATSDLQESIQRLQATSVVPPQLSAAANLELRGRLDNLSNMQSQTLAAIKIAATSPPQPSMAANSDFREQMDHLSNIQSQTLAVVQGVAGKMGVAVSPERQLRLQKAGVALLEEEKARRENALADHKAKLAELISTLRVPDEVAGLASDKALGMPSLKRYWPYFEARRNMELQQLVTERVNLRLIQEKVNLEMEEKLRNVQ